MTREIEALKTRIKELEEENAELKIDIETYKNMES
jgi:regulator of replication initiation timing